MSALRPGLRRVDWPALVRAETLLTDLSEAAMTGGVELALVGGAVRDLLLGRAPRDFDFILAGSEATTEGWLAAWAARQGTRPVAFDKRGVRERRVALPGRDLDFVLVPPGGMETDLERRDFTLNALAVRLPGGALLDPTGGLADLTAGRLRRAGREAFADDPLRALRAVRLLAEGIATQVEDETLTALRGAAAGLSRTSGERIRGELDRMAATVAWAAALRRLHDWGCLAVIAPECAALAGVTQNAWHHLDVWEHTLATLEGVDRPEALAARSRPRPTAAPRLRRERISSSSSTRLSSTISASRRPGRAMRRTARFTSTAMSGCRRNWGPGSAGAGASRPGVSTASPRWCAPICGSASSAPSRPPPRCDGWSTISVPTSSCSFS